MQKKKKEKKKKKMLETIQPFLTFQYVFRPILSVKVSAKEETLYCCGNFFEILFSKLLINSHRRSRALFVAEATFAFEMKNKGFWVRARFGHSIFLVYFSEIKYRKQ